MISETVPVPSDQPRTPSTGHHHTLPGPCPRSLLPRAAHACREPLRRKDEAPWHSPTADGQLSGGLSTAGSPPLWIVGRRRRPARPVAAAPAPWLPEDRLSRPGRRL